MLYRDKYSWVKLSSQSQIKIGAKLAYSELTGEKTIFLHNWAAQLQDAYNIYYKSTHSWYLLITSKYKSNISAELSHPQTIGKCNKIQIVPIYTLIARNFPPTNAGGGGWGGEGEREEKKRRNTKNCIIIHQTDL